jgi:CheY-like chemotaxis protein
MTDQARKLSLPPLVQRRPNALRIGSGTLPKRLTRVMVVDDDPVTRQVVAAILGSQGYDVVLRAEALGTLAAISREQPDVVVLDVNLPGLSGDALARLVSLRKGPRIQVILHSSQSEAELRRLVEESGALGSIEKGDPRDFLGAFEALLRADLER